MTIAAGKKTWTDEELLALPRDGYEREIVNGELVMSPGGAEHGMIIMRIASRLGTFVLDHKLGEVLDGQTGCRMKSEDLFSPDVSFVCTERWNAHRKTNTPFFQGGPDLAVEVLSPGDRVKVTEEKLKQYFANGTRLAWVVDLGAKRAMIYHGPTGGKALTVADSLDGEDVVPGFSLALRAVFE